MTIPAHLRLFRASFISRFLGLFAEVRSLRHIEAKHRSVLQNEQRITNEARQNEQLSRQELADANRALSVMTEARLNADRAVEVMRGELNMLNVAHEREVSGLKQMIDWFGIETRDRQVFGSAPEQKRLEEETVPLAPIRQFRRGGIAQEAAAELARQAEEIFRRGGDVPLPENGAEYASTRSEQGGM